jgi:hypothetical protein
VGSTNAAIRHDFDDSERRLDEMDRRIDEIFDRCRDDLLRTFRIWLTLSQLVVVETVAAIVLLD